MRILAIDDNRDNLTTLQAVLSDRLPDAEVLTALNGPDGLDLALSEDPDVILLDIVMPGMDGYEVCRKLKEHPSLAAIPVLFLTATRTYRASRVKALEAGAEGFLSKPFDELELAAQIRSMVKIKAASTMQRTENERLAALVEERTRHLMAELDERKRAEVARHASERALQESEARLRRAQAIAHVGDWELAIASGIMSGSVEAFRIHGLEYRTGGIPLDLIWRMIDSEDQPRLDAATCALLEGQRPYDEEYRILRASDGAQRVVHSVANLECDGEGTPLKIIGTVQDVTERRQADEALRESVSLLHNVLDLTPAHICAKNLEGRFLLVNQKLANFYGRTAEEMTGMLHAELCGDEEELAQMLAADRDVMESGQHLRIPDETMERPGGSAVVLDTHKIPFTANGAPAVLIIAEDVTERRQAEAELQASEARLQDIISSMGGWVWETDENGTCSYMSQKGIDILGVPLEDILGKTPFDFMLPDEAERVAARLSEILTSKAPIVDLDYWIVRPDGERVDLLTNAFPILGEAGDFRGYRGVDRNITERKQAERLQHLSSEVLGILNEPISFAATIQRTLAAIKGETGCDAVGMRLQDGDDFPYFYQEGFSAEFVAAENSLADRNDNGDVCRDENGNICLSCTCGLVISGKADLENPLFSSGGSFWTNDSSPLLDLSAEQDPRRQPRNRCIHDGYASVALIPVRANQEIVGLLHLNDRRKGCFTLRQIQFFEGICASIGIALVRNRAQEQLRASEEEFRVLVENMQIGLVVHAPDGTVSFANPLASQLLGQTPGEMYGKSAADPTWFFIREDGERALPVEYPVNRALANDSVTAQVLGIVRGDGSDTTWVQCNTHSAQDSEGRCKQMIVTFLDITQRRKAKEALQESEQRFRTFFDGSLHFALILDEKGTVLEMNGRCSEATGQYARGVVGNPLWEAGWWKEFPDVQEKTKAAIRRSSEGENTDDEVTFIDADHRIHHGLRTFSPIGNGADGVKTIAVVGLDITERKRAEEVILRQQYSLEKAQELGQIGSWELDLRQNSLSWSDENYRIFGVPPGSVVDYETFLERVHPDDRDDVHREWSAALGGRPYDIEHRLAGHGVMRWVREKASVEFDEEGKAVRALGFTQDITEHKLLEERLRQSERMDAIGQLAGGVAHDFNNMLAVILGHTEIVLDGMDPTQPIYADLQEVLRATERSADLTRQLLTFARKQVVAPEVLDVNKTLAGMLKMLRRLIGENINLDWQPKEGLWSVMMDPSQIDQILANLCVNARDAIGDVGAITITLGNVTLDEACSPGHVGPAPGEYVLLSVSDNGCGMDQKTVAQVFEPFFTTKEVGKGTGLGLATVYGIVQQNGGGIDICSEPGRGTTFEIYLPRHVHAAPVAPHGANAPIPRGTETILLVEDELAILRMATRMLEHQGYTVLAANSPAEAICLARDRANEIQLLLTDVIMPEMNGRDLAKNLLSICPHLVCLFMSGYTADAIAQHGVLDEGIHFVQKPFSIRNLGAKVREALGGISGPGAPQKR